MVQRFVYVIGVTDNPVKIGVTDKPNIRLSTLQVGCPDLLILHWKARVYEHSAQEIETAVHRLLKEHHRRGEWYNVTVEQAKEAIHSVAPKITEINEARARRRGDDIDQVSAIHAVSYRARQTVVKYRSMLADRPSSIKHYDGAIAQRAGIGALAAFRTVIVQRRSLDIMFAGRHVLRAKAEAALADALNALVQYDLERHDKALDLYRRNHVEEYPTSGRMPA